MSNIEVVGEGENKWIWEIAPETEGAFGAFINGEIRQLQNYRQIDGI